LSVWDAETGKVLTDLPESKGTINHAAFSKNGERLKAWNGAGELREWDFSTAKEVQFRQGFTTAKSTQFLVSPGEAYVAVVEGKNIKLHNSTTGEVLRQLGHTDRISNMAFSLDDRYLGAASHDNKIKVWETATGRDCCTFSGHTDSVRCLAFSADGSRMASGGMDNLIRIWDAQTGQELRTFENPWGRIVESVAFSPDGKRLASGSVGASVALWDIESGQEVLEIPTAHALVTFVTFSPEGSRLAALCIDGTVLIWDGSGGR
jgi:WD40 repeat protein